MATRVVLHIGAMKSGTSFVQATLGANREALAEQGVLFPGTRWREQVHAVIDVLDQTRDGKKPAKSVGAWQRLVGEVAAWPGTAVVSMEFLGPAKHADIEKIIGSFAPAEVHVVLTVRDLARNIPAMWQEETQNAATWTWEQYVDEIAQEGPLKKRAGRAFWRHQDTPAIARHWLDVVGREHFTLITLPPPGADRGLLWQRFCSVLGIDSASCEPAERSNPSLGAASALVMRALNEKLDELGLSKGKYNRYAKHALAKRGLATRKSQEPQIGFEAKWVQRRSKQMIKEFKRLDMNVVGNLDELRPLPVRGVDPADVSDREQLDAAIDGLAHLIRMWSRS